MLAAALTSLCLLAPAPLKYDLRVDVPVSAAFGAWWLVSEYALKAQLAPAQCRWCARNGIDDAARAIRAPLEKQKGVSTVSDVTGIMLTPVVVLGIDWLSVWQADGNWKDAAIDSLLILEAMVTSQAFNQAVKFAAGRERPFVAELPPAEKALTAQPADNNLSFFSGHSSYTFSLVAAGATVARLRGYARWWLVLVAGLPLAATTAVLRMVADKHYLTDVLTGAAFGSLIGFGLPWLFHQPLEAGGVTLRVSPGPGGVALTGVF